jgi:hypothetical protein
MQERNPCRRRVIGAVQVLAVGLVLASWAAPGRAQFIAVKSLPIAAGDQFLIFPSRNLALGGLSIALDDPLLDPFVNPAKGSAFQAGQLFGAPTFYNVSGGEGAARTLPVGVTFGAKDWFGALSFSLQQLEAADRSPIIFLRPGLDFVGPAQQTLRDRTANNMYAFGLLGRRIRGTRLSLGASVLYADLQALDGVDLLYALSERIQQDGSMADVRLALAGHGENGSAFEAMVLHNHFDMRHDVDYVRWLPCPLVGPCDANPRLVTETNLDRTNTWGVHFGYRRPVGENGWTVGGMLTSNWKSHPKIPNYEIANIPRDPGNTWAYNFGLGIARTDGPAVVGAEIIFEPIWSDTWAVADTAVKSASGRTLLPGDKTIENDFRFANARLRLGAGRETERYGIQLGVEVRSYDYTLQQHDNVRESRREQQESWMEWTPTWGGTLKFPELHIRYMGRLTTGTGRPGIAWTGAARASLDLAAEYIVAPAAPLTLQEAKVMTHQIMVSLPIR